MYCTCSPLAQKTFYSGRRRRVEAVSALCFSSLRTKVSALLRIFCITRAEGAESVEVLALRLYNFLFLFVSRCDGTHASREIE